RERAGRSARPYADVHPARITGRHRLTKVDGRRKHAIRDRHVFFDDRAGEWAADCRPVVKRKLKVVLAVGRRTVVREPSLIREGRSDRELSARQRCPQRRQRGDQNQAFRPMHAISPWFSGGSGLPFVRTSSLLLSSKESRLKP